MKPETLDQIAEARAPQKDGGPSTLMQWLIVIAVLALLFGGAAYLM